MSDLKRAQNLARIRDNQRRSRARRKEYINELEVRLRNCEQAGIEASAEIQNAARRVLEENRKLRLLLHEQGLSDSDIAMSMGSVNGQTYDGLSAVPALSAMLDRRMMYNGPSRTSSPTSTHSYLPSAPPLSIPVPRSATVSNDSPSPNSIVSSMGTPPKVYGSPFYNSPTASNADGKYDDLPQYMPFSQPLNTTWSYSTEPPYLPSPSDDYSTSNVDAANIISTMRLESNNGYGNETGSRVPSQNYFVNNSIEYTTVDGQMFPRRTYG
ncbi:hypothetical protein DM02DRAFT_557668 [Periconia macrospinosa]|uniref:BZIP domain-containing protein n=1 Tax=Periconia macrospinosa TaxID=97972 RepID=A0A2V1DZD0_9PLEO|nr:hypothetical protein DM02DRAFT_557668 [Periconia macrospinosa]